ncbi:KpsF/GutQ family sugar-phosphate isomerase [Ruficoccus amylovorans]|uniref:KpsF/GutQ family sugar-phosphate isomerase n=1 Tax=Ruficoccus amylovorans TaxID=1804625 RepID=A0A842HJ68_9BACT|nr:KpsF/GutQ family sugar-phosphate isomerase [Ruficoccus amylovorans]MBC2595626.1 KpsF/GutQ family sugar-phosphate isomerase [Ruficoccus amylovorans]
MNTEKRTHFSSALDVFERGRTALDETLERMRPNFDAFVEALLAVEGKIVLTGIGKSGIIAHKLAATFASTGTPAVYINAAEALHGDLGVVGKGDVVLMVSNSAETVEMIKMLPSIKHIGAKALGIFGKTNTPLAARCDLVLDASIEREACPLNLAPMTSAMIALVIGDALAVAMMNARHFRPEQFALFHPGGTLGRRLLLTAADVMLTGDQMPVVPAQASFEQLIGEMSRPNLGAVLVVDGENRLLGIITDGDIRRAMLPGGGGPCEASKLMTAHPKSVHPETLAGEIMDLMEQYQIYVVPVVDAKGCLAGILRMHDILG